MKRSSRYIIFFGLLGLLGCTKVDIESIQNLNGDRISIIGHGGVGLISPENTLPLSSLTSLLKAVEGYNADGVEADVQISADSVLLLFHDQRLELQTNCSGCIAEQAAASVEKCRYRANFSTHLFMDERVSRLEPFIERMALRPIRPLVILDVKTTLDCATPPERNAFLRTLVRQLDRLIQRYDGEEWIYIDSGDLDFLRLLRQTNEQIKLIFARPWSEELPGMALAEQFSGLCLRFDGVNAEQVRTAHESGLKVMLWDIRDRPAAVRAVNKSPDYVLTDQIPLLQQILQK